MSDWDDGDARREYETEVDDEAQDWGVAATNQLATHDEGTAFGRTRYEDRDTIDQRAADVAQGRVVDSNDQYMHGTFGWVVDEQTGYLLFLPPDQIVVHFPDGHDENLTRAEFVSRRAELASIGATYERIHHTTPVAGMPVTGAGIMELQDGWIVSVSDESGHYRPTAENQYNALVALEEQGYALERPVSAADSPDGVAGYRGTTVSLTGADGGGRPTNKAAWLAQEQAANPYMSVDELELKWEQFEQTGGDELLARRRDALNREFLATMAARRVDPETLQADPNFEFDPTNNMFRDNQTYAYYSAETGEVVYVYDAEEARYVDTEGNPL
jgi:hypothetical protein